MADTRKPYVLGRPFWDGRVRHEPGSIVYFPEGTQPPRAKLMDSEPEPEASSPKSAGKKTDS